MAGRDYAPFAGLFETPLRNGLTKPKAVRGEGMKMVNMGEVFAYRRIHNLDMDRVPMDSRERDTSLLRDGDLLFARQSLVLSGAGKCVLFQGDKEDVTFESHIIRCRLDQRKAEPAFYFYLFQSSQGRSLIESIVEQVAAAGIRGSDLGRLAVPVPPLAEQKAIAAVLGALDDKIDLNRRMNATLEAMARALFQSWFVDFDPVRAKLDGRPPAALFPEHFQDSEAGHIPKGWTLGKVSDLATLNRGAVNPGDFPSETFDHFSLPAFDNGRTPKVELGSAIMSNKFTVTPNSVLLSKLNPHIPRIWLPDLHASRRSVCSTEFMVLCSKPGVSREYLFSLFTSSAFASIYGTLVTGTTGSHQRIRPESVLDMKIVIPSPPLIRAFTDIAKPMFDRINRNTDQSRTLATLRDTLLPKLLSGEIQPTRDLCQEL
jgi:type I restriction enzyme S subunit